MEFFIGLAFQDYDPQDKSFSTCLQTMNIRVVYLHNILGFNIRLHLKL